MKVVSLLPAATEILAALSLRASLVGRSHECDHPEDVRALPAPTKARLDPSLPSAELDAQVRRIVAQRLPIYMLDVIEAAGGILVGPPAGAPSPTTTWQEIQDLRADALVVAPCGFDLPRSRAEAEPLQGVLRSLAARVLLLDGNAYLNRPSPRLVDAVEIVAAWLRGSPVPAEQGISLEPAVVA
jgi:hypothetical protein